MATAKLTEMPLSFPPHLSCKTIFPVNFLKPFSSSSLLRTTKIPIQNSNFNSDYYSSWLKKWPPPSYLPPLNYKKPRTLEQESPSETTQFLDPEPIRQKTSPVDRIVLRLRNLGLGSDDEEEEGIEEDVIGVEQVSGEDKLGDLLKRDWVRPDKMLIEVEEEEDSMTLPWERDAEKGEGKEDEEGSRTKKRSVKAPTLAELTIEDGELRRLRRMGMTLRERINVPKAGVTKEVLEKIYDKWRKSELVRLKFHEDLASDMRTGHEIVERRTGGLVIWRSGSVMVMFRGTNYERPPTFQAQSVNREGDTLFVPEVSSFGNPLAKNDSHIHDRRELVIPRSAQIMTEEEAEFNSLLDGLGPRFEEWWGTGILPVDADLLPQKVRGYKTPFRLLPTRMRPRLSNTEMTNLRKLARSTPCHFALGRNRNHQGLAAAIIKLWERSLVVKIAVKRGIQNTNNKLMAEELKNFTGGVLLLRNKYYIVIYRGKDFLPPSVAAALAERQEMTKQTQDEEEKVRGGPTEPVPMSEEGQALAGTLAEFYEAQARWGREISVEERENMIEEASRAKTARVVKRLEHKLSISQAKKLKAEKLLTKIISSWVPVAPDDDQETITVEERAMFRRVGLRMKAYLPLGIRGVFDGVIENMHLHWKHRELVKLLSKEKEIAFVDETARLLEYESGGILVAIERVPKGFVLIFYRGKNYQRPISLRPRNLLTKAKALKRRVALQRYEALSQHIGELENTIEQTRKKIGDPQAVENSDNDFSEGEDENSQMAWNVDENDSEWEEDDEDSESEDFK